MKLNYDKNKEIARNKFKVMGLPTFIFMDCQENIVKRETGFSNIEEFKKDFLKTAKKILENPPPGNN